MAEPGQTVTKEVAEGSPKPGSVSSDLEDWEREAEAGLQSLRLTTAPAEGVEPVDSASRDLRPSVQLSSSRQHAGPSPGKADEPLVAFAGRHILELSSLPATFSDAKLEALLHSTAPGAVPPVTRRVDASTLLVVFANPDQAAAALHALSHQMTAKPYAQACKASKLMPAEDLQPPRPRPQTSAAVANRLIGHALNTRDTRNKDVEQRLRDQKQAAAAKAKQRSEQLTAAWDG